MDIPVSHSEQITKPERILLILMGSKHGDLDLVEGRMGIFEVFIYWIYYVSIYLSFSVHICASHS